MKTKLSHKLIILLLLISNGFTAFLLLKPGRPKHPPFLSEKIGLSGEQFEKAKKIELSLFEQMRPIEQRIEQLHAELFIHLDQLDQTKEDSLQRVIGSLIVKKDELVLSHFKKIYALCSPDQKQKFKSEIKEHFSNRHHPPRK